MRCGRAMETCITETILDNVILLKIIAEKISFDNVSALNESLNKNFINKNIKLDFIINLQNVHSIDSTGVGLLLSLVSYAKNNNKLICCFNTTKGVNKLLRLTNMDSIPIPNLYFGSSLEDCINFIKEKKDENIKYTIERR